MNASISHIPPTKAATTSCFHCGETCNSEIVHDGKAFCCEGCKVVYGILQDNDLCNYYDLNKAAGTSLKGKTQAQYAYLDQKEVVQKLIDYTDGEIIKVRFHLPQIHCSSCLWLLENLYRLNEGVRHSRVNFPKKEVQLVFEEKHTSLRQIVELLDSIGYAPAINLQSLDQSSEKAVDQSLYYQLGLAGFVFGNIMLLSFPEYLGLEEGEFAHFFGYLNLLLILPVLLYSGKGYFQSAWQGLKHRHLNIDVPISLGILSLFGRSAFEILSQSGAGYLDSLAGLIFFLLIGKWFQQQTFHKISFDRDYKSYFPIACTVKTGQHEVSTTLDKLQAGDRLLIRHGELIPADAILIDGVASIDYSFVTGESSQIHKTTGDRVFAGGRQMGGMIEVEVVKAVSQSYLTQLWNEAAFTKTDEKGATSQLADTVAKYFTWIILLVAAMTLAYWLPRDTSTAINAFTAVLIIACPCAVALSIPFTFGNVLRLMGKEGFYLKNIQVIEALAGIQHLVFDKTGTLTNADVGQIHHVGEDLKESEKQWIRSLVHQSAHPLSRQIDAAMESVDLHSVHHFEELKGKGICGEIQGHNLRIGSYAFITGNQKNNNSASQSVYLQIDGKTRGHFLFQAHYREGLTAVLTALSQHWPLSLLSGDHDGDKAQLIPLFGGEEHLHFQQSPSDKLQFIKALQARQRVLMLGDGLNDAGALRQSDVGVVITENTANFTPACDAVLDARQFEKIPLFVAFAQKSIRLVYVAYFIALIYNIIGLSFAVQGSLSPVVAAILMPLSSVSIVLFGIGASELVWQWLQRPYYSTSITKSK